MTRRETRRRKKFWWKWRISNRIKCGFGPKPSEWKDLSCVFIKGYWKQFQRAKPVVTFMRPRAYRVVFNPLGYYLGTFGTNINQTLSRQMQTTWSKLRSKSTTFHNESKHFYNKIGFFDFFPYFSNAGGPPKIWKVQLFKTFWQEMSKVASMGPGKYQREQSHELWWI